ncbi:MAG TPA: FliH/SctL family protein [Bryobacteraceae bacterium]|nr:FliH/SctL family protein [Bryobacteraceae bacterium]
MSCKVRPPGEPQTEEPLPLRQVREESFQQMELAPAMAARLAQAERECQQREQAAHAAGVREGEAAGRRQGQAELQPEIARLARSIEEMAGLRARFRREAEADLIALAMAIARRVLRREIAVDPEALHGLVLGALEKMQSQEIRRVKVHPSHAAAVAACLKETGGPPVEVIADAAREPGAVIFESERGNLDASVESQLREIERGLADRLRRSK